MVELGNAPLYAFSCASFVMLAALAAVSVLQCSRHRRQQPSRPGGAKGGLQLFALAGVMGFTTLRAFNSLAHVARFYVDMPNFVKHSLFVIPLALAFSAFSVVIFLWFRIANIVRRRVSQSTIVVFGASNAFVYAMVVVSIVCHFVFQGAVNEFRVVGWTNTALAALFVVGGAAFGVYGARVVVVVRSTLGPVEASRSQMHQRKVAALRRVSMLMSACLFCFGISCIILVYEGVTLITTGSFVAADGEYTTTPALEWLLFLGQTVPQAVLVFVLWKSPSKKTQPASRVSSQGMSRASSSSRSSRQGQQSSGSGATGGPEPEGLTVPLLGIANRSADVQFGRAVGELHDSVNPVARTQMSHV